MRLSLILFITALAAACSPTPEPPPDAGEPRKCVGGVLRPDGTCEAKCDPSKCLPGNTCVDNKCVLKCTAHSQCQKYTQSCLPAKEDDTLADIFTCQDVPMQEYGDPCPNGNECGGYCQRTGPGDSRAYCTFDCLEDSDCPAGYECGFVRDPHQICGTTKGNNGHCGTTVEGCIERAEIELPESGLLEGSYCIQRRVCLKRESCAPCESDVDCSWGLDLVCAETAFSGKRCAPRCTKDSDCDQNKYCEFEVGKEVGACLPRTGSCTGGGFCTTCRFDTDCDPGLACMQLHGFEKACLDPSFSTPCTTDADCPVSPSGLHGECITLQSSGGGTVRRCYAPNNGSFNSCW